MGLMTDQDIRDTLSYGTFSYVAPNDVGPYTMTIPAQEIPSDSEEFAARMFEARTHIDDAREFLAIARREIDTPNLNATRFMLDLADSYLSNALTAWDE